MNYRSYRRFQFWKRSPYRLLSEDEFDRQFLLRPSDAEAGDRSAFDRQEAVQRKEMKQIIQPKSSDKLSFGGENNWRRKHPMNKIGTKEEVLIKMVFPSALVKRRTRKDRGTRDHKHGSTDSTYPCRSTERTGSATQQMNQYQHQSHSTTRLSRNSVKSFALGCLAFLAISNS